MAMFAAPPADYISVADDIQTSAARELTVTGSAELCVSPDYADLPMRIYSLSQTVTGAREENLRRIASFQRALPRCGFARQDVQISEMMIMPLNASVSDIYNYAPGPSVPCAFREASAGGKFRAQSNLTVHLPDISKVSNVTDVATHAGVNYIGPVQYELKNRLQLNDQISVMAVKNATHKAHLIADAAGMVVLKLQSLREENAAPTMNYVSDSRIVLASRVRAVFSVA